MNKILNSFDHKTSPGSRQSLCDHVATTDGSSELMTEAELIQFLRIPEISDSTNFHNVIEHLKRNRDLPRIHICNKALYPKKSVLEWIEKETSG